MRSGGRLAAVAGAACALALGVAGPAAAGTEATTASESACYNAYALCNNTSGTYNQITIVRATRKFPETAKVGFFEVFGPNGYKKTGPTGPNTVHNFEVYRSFASGSLICVSFWEKHGDGTFGKYGGVNGNACTRTPIG